MKKNIFIIFIILLFFYNYNSSLKTQILVKSNFDNNYYLVNKYNKKKLYSSYLLSIIRYKIIYLIENIKITIENRNYIENIKNKIYQTKFMENKNMFPKKKITSYSVNKGEKIVLCLFDYKKKNFFDLNTLIFVSIHEVAHIGNPTIGHDESFYYIFNILLNQAIQLKIYNFYDYENIPKEYCGIVINSNI